MKKILLPVLLLLCSCNRTFDAPEAYTDPEMTATLTISELKALHTVKGRFDRITIDKVIAGIVTADDRSGNFYKNIVLQDETGGISLLLERAALYNDYPVGRKVYVKVKGLMLGDYRGLVQLGADIDISDPSDLSVAGIASSLISKYLVKGSLNNVVTPALVTHEQLTTAMQDVYQNRLIQLNEVEFAVADSNATYANISARLAGNYQLNRCAEAAVVLRNSAYAAFAGIRLPKGSGTITGIYTVYNSSRQLMIRDTADVQLKGERCRKTVSPSQETAYTKGIELPVTAPLLLSLDAIDSSLPAGISVRTGVSATDSGDITGFALARNSWAGTSGGFKNYASAEGLPATSTQAQQHASGNRAIGIRQVSATDKGAAFVIEINNTIARKDITLEFSLQSLDAGAGRTTTWMVDYAQGLQPVQFLPLTTAPAIPETGGNRFGNTAVKVVLPADVENSSRKLTLRIVVLTPTSGSGSRAVSAVDNIRINWH